MQIKYLNKDYTKELGKLKKELWIHQKIRKILNNFTDKDYDKLIDLINKDKVKEILKKQDRDSPFSLLKQVIFAEPRFLLFMRKFIKDL